MNQKEIQKGLSAILKAWVIQHLVNVIIAKPEDIERVADATQAAFDKACRETGLTGSNDNHRPIKLGEIVYTVFDSHNFADFCKKLGVNPAHNTKVQLYEHYLYIRDSEPLKKYYYA